MASIRKLKNGNFQATVSCGRDSTGKQIRKYITASTERECKAAAREYEQDYYEGNISNFKDIRFNKFAQDWLASRESEISTSTMESYHIYVNVHFIPYFGKKKLSQITEYDVTNYKTQKLKTLSPTTVRKHLYVLQKMFSLLKHKNPVTFIEKPSPSYFKPHVITDHEFEIICSFFKDKSYEPIILLAGLCGLRRGEICALKWNDINSIEKTITIDESLAKCLDNEYKLKSTKSLNGIRTIEAPDIVFKLLEKKKRQQKVIQERIFTQNPSTITDWFSKCMIKLDLPDVRFHDLRHYHTTWLYEQGIPDLYAAKRLGDDVQTIKKIYQHVRDSAQSKYENKITTTQNIMYNENKKA